MESLFTDGWPNNVIFSAGCCAPASIGANAKKQAKNADGSSRSIAISSSLSRVSNHRDVEHVAREHPIDQEAEQAIDGEAKDTDGQQRHENPVGLQEQR